MLIRKTMFMDIYLLNYLHLVIKQLNVHVGTANLFSRCGGTIPRCDSTIFLSKEFVGQAVSTKS